MRRLWIFGDSFSKSSDRAECWYNLLAQDLNTELINVSLRGSSPDWILRQYLSALSQIDPDDPVIVLFTNPNRFWFYEDQPDLTNPAILDFGQHRDRDQAQAADSYFRYLQRPELDLQWTYYRAMAVSHETQRLGLRRPLMVKCFEQSVSAAESFATVTWARGSLSQLQFDEYQDRDTVLKEIADTGRDPIFRGWDCRYNHLCLSNHRILADRFRDYFVNGTVPDLTAGFHQGLLSTDWINDSEFQQRELDLQQIQLFREQNQPKNLFKVWRSGLDR